MKQEMMKLIIMILQLISGYGLLIFFALWQIGMNRSSQTTSTKS